MSFPNQTQNLLGEKYNMKVVVGTYPIPEKYIIKHNKLGAWDSPEWEEIIRPAMTDEKTRCDCD